MPKYQPIARINFAAESHPPSVAFGPGWSHPEPGHRWALGQSAVLRIEVPQGQRDFTVLACLRPYLHAPDFQSQRIEVMHGGKLVFSERISGYEMIAFAVRANAAENGTLTLRFLFPESRPPSAFGLPEMRPLACDFFELWVVAPPPPSRHLAHPLLSQNVTQGGAAGAAAPPPAGHLPPRELLLNFVSLGHCCDFAMIQRRFGADPHGLLRFAAIATANLSRGLMNDFAGIGEFDNIVPYIPEGLDEVWIRERAYWFAYHAFIKPGTASDEQLKHREARRLPMLRDKLLKDLADADKIFVLRRPEPLADYETLGVLTALRLHGDHAVLKLDQGTGATPGTVEILQPGLMLGHLDGALGDPPSPDTWLAICKTAYECTHASRATCCPLPKASVQANSEYTNRPRG
jgi:hypothetical protein